MPQRFSRLRLGISEAVIQRFFHEQVRNAKSGNGYCGKDRIFKFDPKLKSLILEGVLW